jgi:hypothetical protein
MSRRALDGSQFNIARTGFHHDPDRLPPETIRDVSFKCMDHLIHEQAHCFHHIIGKSETLATLVISKVCLMANGAGYTIRKVKHNPPTANTGSLSSADNRLAMKIKLCNLPCLIHRRSKKLGPGPNHGSCTTGAMIKVWQGDFEFSHSCMRNMMINPPHTIRSRAIRPKAIRRQPLC